MNEDLKPVYDALRKADAAGNVEDAKRLADYIRSKSATPEASAPIEAPTESTAFDKISPLAGYVGSADAALSLGANAAMAPVAGILGFGQGIDNKIGNVFTGVNRDAGDVVRDVQNMAYKPRTQMGKTILESAQNIAAAPGRGLAGLDALARGDNIDAAVQESEKGIGHFAEGFSDAATRMGASPEVAGAIGSAVTAAPTALGIAAGAQLGAAKVQASKAATEASRASIQAIAEQATQKAGFDWAKLNRETRLRLTEMAQEAGTAEGLDPASVTRVARAASLSKPIQMTRGQAIRSPAELRAEGQLAYTKEGAPIEEAHLSQNASLQDNLDLLKVNYKGTAANAEEIGRRATKALESARNQANRKVGQLYRRAEEAGDTSGPVKLDSAQAHDFVSYLGEHPEPDFINFVGNSLRQYFRKDQETGHLLLREGVDEIPVNALENTIKAANAIKRTDMSTRGHYAGEVASKIDAMIPDEAGGALYKEARSARRELAQKFDDPKSVSNLIQGARDADRKVALENVFDRAVLSRSSSKAQLSRVMDTLTKEGSPATRKLGTQAVADMKAHAVQYIKDEATKGVSTDRLGNASLSPAALKNARDRIGAGKLELLLGKEGLAELDNIIATAGDVKTIPATNLGSSTTINAISLLDKFMDKLKHAPIGGLGRGVVGKIQEIRETGSRESQVQRAVPFTLREK